MDINRTAPAIAEAEIQIGALAALKAEAEGRVAA
jgi:hypothetical protein